MAIQPEIALQGRPPVVQSPLDMMQKNVSVADMLSAISERQQLTKQRAAEAPLRAAYAETEMQKLKEQTALKNGFDMSVKYNPDTGDLDYDQPKAAQYFAQQGMPHLMEAYQAQADQQRAAHRMQAINEATAHAKQLETVATPAENFLALEDDTKKKQAWPQLRSAIVQFDKSVGKVLPYEYDPTVVDSKLQQIVQAYAQTKDIKEKLDDAKNKETLSLTTPEGREAEIAKQTKQFTAQNGGKPPDQETMDAIREGVMQKAGFAGFKIQRKTPGRAQFSPPMTADKLPPDAATVTGEPITDRDPKNEYVAIYHSGEVIGYQPKAKTTTAVTLAERAAAGDKDAQAALDKLQRPTVASLAMQAAQGDQAAAAALKLFPSQAGTAPLSEDAVTMDARKYLAGAPLGTFGMGGAKYIVAIKNKAAEISKGADIATQTALYKSQTSALTQIQKNAASINAFENTALANIEVLQKTMKSVVDSGSPVLNKPLRDIDEKALGSPEVAAFKAARLIATTEIAKVLNNPNSSVALSDSARHEAQSLIGEGATMAQLYKIVDTLKQDMVNRRKGFQDEINARTRAIQDLSPVAHDAAQPEPTTATPASKIIRYDAQGNRIP